MRGPARIITATWLAMLLLALASAWLVDHRASDGTTTALIMFLAAMKAGLVLIHFMDLGKTPTAIKASLAAWTGACVMLVLALR